MFQIYLQTRKRLNRYCETIKKLKTIKSMHYFQLKSLKTNVYIWIVEIKITIFIQILSLDILF